MSAVDFPSPPSDLSAFPDRHLNAGTTIHRLHHRELGPFWFAASPTAEPGGNRFDLPTPRGASYWALQPVVAILETLARRPVRTIPSSLLERYALTAATLSAPLGPIANLPVKRARRYGLTAELFTTADRPSTKAWAVALADAGFVAVIGLPRHDVTGRHRTLTLWGRAGEHRPASWATTTTTPVGSQAAELRKWGIRVLPIPYEVAVSRPQ